ncbi:metal ABC transporter substrate-binding protein [Luteolibacter sp. AS25]|uniref:metal ABC transporter substrate-binding protein n=1 Tax=Luteolibacter sp. AS25 TaxID=3135776 RepID=UPI00398BAE6A
MKIRNFPKLLATGSMIARAVCYAFALAVPSVAFADLTVATLHPMMTDLARQVGGDHVKVLPLMKAGEDIHKFTPSSDDMVKAKSADVLLASGKGLELYLPRLKGAIGGSTKVLEAGNAARSVKLSASDSAFACCPQHAAGSIDPHWWHSVSGMKSAAAYVGKEFGKLDPANKSEYEANAKRWGKELDGLESWAKREFSRIPRSKRYLVTAHAAFGYFCRDFGFKSIPVSGASEENGSSQYLAEVIEIIHKNGVNTAFPEENANPRALDSIIKTAGIRKGKALIADGSAAGVTTYKAFIEHNVDAVVSGLASGS